MNSILRLAFESAVVLGLFFASPIEGAWAQEDDGTSRAREAYTRGEKLAAAGDLQGAATAFAEADWLAPNPTALEAALEAAIRADDAALGMNLVERAARSPADLAIGAVKTAREGFASRVGALVFPCLEATAPCKPSLRGVPVTMRRVWVVAGNYDVFFEGKAKPVAVFVGAGAERSVDPPALEIAAPPVTPIAPTKKDEGLDPLWTLIPATLTVAFGGVLIGSIVQIGTAESDLEAFQRDEDPGAGASEAERDAFLSGQQAIIDEGESWSTMAGIFGGLTAAAGAATVVVLVVALVTSSDDEPAKPTITGHLVPLDGGFSAGLTIVTP